MRFHALPAALLALVFAGTAMAAAGVADTPLDRYLDGLQTWSASFTQEVTDARGRRLQDGQGRLVVVRPGRFRWESSPAGEAPGVQLLVADGRNLWFLDRDLAQVTVRPLVESLPSSPAMLLAGGGPLREAFDVIDEGRRDGLEWVKVVPREQGSDFREASFGFRGAQLVRLSILDSLGQQSALRFSDVHRNQAVDPAEVAFEPPAEADVIGTPVP